MADTDILRAAPDSAVSSSSMMRDSNHECRSRDWTDGAPVGP